MTPPRTAPAGWDRRERGGGRRGISFRGEGREGWSWACRALLGVPVHDVTGGFKCWRRQVLEALPLEEVRCRGFAFQIEMNYLCWRQGYFIAEGPGNFVHTPD